MTMRNLPSILPRLFLAAAALLLASCFQEERSYTLNPDGSGKVEFKATFPLDSAIQLDFGGGAKPGPEKKAKDAVTKILEESEGVAAWTDVSYKINDEGKLEFQGTAYFGDVNKLKLNMGSMSADSLLPVFTKEKGQITVECSLATKKQEAAAGNDRPKWDEMTEKEQKAALAKARQELMQMKAMVAGVAFDMSSKVTIHLPAPTRKASGFEKLSDTSFTVASTGAMLVEEIDKLLADENLLQAMAGADLDMDDGPPEELLGTMFGTTENPSLSFAADAAAAFDYKKELAAARKAAPAMLKKLGLTVVPPPPMIGKAEFKSLRLAGLRVATPSTDDDVRPFNWSAGTTLAFIGELPGAVISAEDGEIETFILDNGQNLLSSKSWDRKPRSVNLSKDGTLLGFEIQSDKLPKADATAIKMLKGEIICMAAGASKVTDLAFAKIAEGEESKHYGAKITEIGKHDYQKDKKKVTIHFDLKRNLIKEVQFFDKDGTRLKSEQNGFSWSGDSGELIFSCDDALSEDSAIKVEVFTGMERHRLPFLIENVPLMPRQPDEK